MGMIEPAWIVIALIVLGAIAFFVFGFKDPRDRDQRFADGGNTNIGAWPGGGDVHRGADGSGGADSGGGGGGGDGGAG